MAVYTDVSDEDLVSFLSSYPVGAFRGKTPILAGVENTNYRVESTGGAFILTVFERRVRAGDLPFFMALMTHLAQKGLPVAAPVADHSGAFVKTLAGKPAALIRFLPGAPEMAPNAGQCAALGEALAIWHADVADFMLSRPNPLALAGWRELARACRDRADECASGLAAFVAEELEVLSALWPRMLPSGVVHTDLFPDNVHFEGDRIVGLIDFYFSANDFFAYDIAVCVNSWCFGGGGAFAPEKARALVGAYQARRKLTAEEIAAFPVLLRGAALRFLLTRLYDWLNQVEGAVVTVKDPLAFRDIVNFHRASYAPDAFGL